MTDSKKQQIGDVLQEAAQSGVLGRKPIGTRQDTPLTPAPAQAAPAAPTQAEQPAEEASKPKRRKPEREKKTILFTTERAWWLEKQASAERRDQSDIVDEALALYEKLYKEK
jgi:hypothetical protein